MAGAYLSILQGDTYSFSTNIAVDGVGTNLSGSYLWFLAKENPEYDEDADAVINASTNGGQISVSGASNNVVTINLNSATTANYDVSNLLYWALKCQTSAGAVYTLDRGRAAVVNPIVIND